MDKCPCCKLSLEEMGGCGGCDRCIDCCKLVQQPKLLDEHAEKYGEYSMYCLIENHNGLYGPDEKQEQEKAMCKSFGGHFVNEDTDPQCAECGVLFVREV